MLGLPESPSWLSNFSRTVANPNHAFVNLHYELDKILRVQFRMGTFPLMLFVDTNYPLPPSYS